MISNNVSLIKLAKTHPWLSAPSLNFFITVPNVIKLLLIWDPSFKRTPSAPVFAARSDPARSTKFWKKNGQ